MVGWAVRVCALLALLAAALPPAGGYADSPGTPPAATYRPARVLVKLRPGASVQELSGGRTLPGIGIVSIPVPPGQELETASRLSQTPGVIFAEPDYIVTAFRAPNDPLLDFYQWNLRMVRAQAAWDLEVGRSDVILAILDTGIDLSHPDLADKVLPGLNLLDPLAPPQDDNGHGSHVAGIASASTNNTRGVAGLSWGARLLPIKVLDSFGQGTVEHLAQGIVWAADQGARVMNISSGTMAPSETLREAVNYAHGVKGAIIVSAVGNEGGFGGFNAPFYPASFPNVIGVGATDSNDRRADFSERGDFVSLAAPGVTIVSSVIAGRGVPALGNDYDYMTGTSMASPLVAGLAALVWSTNLGLTNEQVTGLMERTAVDLGTPGRDEFFGFGRIDAYAAAKAAISAVLAPSPAAVPFLLGLDRPERVTEPLDILNLGGKPLEWTATISPTVPWLSLSRSAGQVPLLGSDRVTLSTAPSAITSAGTYTASLILSGQGDVLNSPAVVPVTLSVLARLERTYFPLIANNLNVAGW